MRRFACAYWPGRRKKSGRGRIGSGRSCRARGYKMPSMAALIAAAVLLVALSFFKVFEI